MYTDILKEAHSDLRTLPRLVAINGSGGLDTHLALLNRELQPSSLTFHSVLVA